MKNKKARKVCTIDVVQQKIRSLDVIAKDVERILRLLKKNFSHISLDKKEFTTLRANLDGYIKVISYSRFSFPIYIIPSLA